MTSDSGLVDVARCHFRRRDLLEELPEERDVQPLAGQVHRPVVEHCRRELVQFLEGGHGEESVTEESPPAARGVVLPPPAGRWPTVNGRC